MVCKPDKEDKETWHAAHITEFYGIDTPPLTFWKDPETGDEFGRPSGYCKDHMKKRAVSRYVPKRMRWFDDDEAGLIQEAEEPYTVEVIKERAGKMGPPEPERDLDWNEEKGVWE
jgi:hypothetical protein